MTTWPRLGPFFSSVNFRIEKWRLAIVLVMPTGSTGLGGVLRKVIPILEREILGAGVGIKTLRY